jgi:hypothetical protein
MPLTSFSSVLTSEPASDHCETCRFFYSDASGQICRRFPPTPFVHHMVKDESMNITQLGQISLHPAVNPALGWCGEFAPAVRSH